MGLSVRRLAPGDAALWQAIWAEARATDPAAFAPRPGDDPAAAPDALAARLASARAFVWQDEAGHPRACALWCRDHDPAEPRRGWIEAMFVAPGLRGRGIAAQLIAAMAEDARAEGVAELWLEVRRDNRAAQAAYARAGFRPAGDAAAHRCPGELALRLALETGPGHAP